MFYNLDRYNIWSYKLSYEKHKYLGINIYNIAPYYLQEISLNGFVHYNIICTYLLI